jgi:cyclopropane-fatty-acyl-phospholipid synthase
MGEGKGSVTQRKVGELFSRADVAVGGGRPWDIRVYNDAFFPRIIAEGSLGLGESYMDGWWDCERLDEFFHRVCRANLGRQVRTWRNALEVARARIVNLQRPARAFEVGRRHYDIGNDLYSRMLDKRMIYSCGYWNGGRGSLEEAQEAKLDLICRKLGIGPGMRVLDIGCGWGGTARFIAENCGAEVVGVTVSERQVEHARELCRGLPVEIRLQDYREVDGVFDGVVSVGMFEHVGVKNYRAFMEVSSRCLRDGGLLLLHTIGRNESDLGIDPWFGKYIFPNSMLPSARQIAEAAEGLFVFEDWHSFGGDYDRTLMHWHHNFEESWPELEERYGERFYRMWRYYLLCCAGSFRARKNQLWQIVYSKGGVEGGYQAPR